MSTYPSPVPSPSDPEPPRPASAPFDGSTSAAPAYAPTYAPGHPQVAQAPVSAAEVPAPAPGTWQYAPRRSFWESKGVRTGALFTVLAVCGVVILALVRHHIGTEPFLVGLALAILPVPLLLWVFLWLDHVAPSPWQNVVFAFSWGSCAATLVALFANEYGAKLLATTFSGTPTQSDHWGATFVAPLVEETAKGTAILLLFLVRRRQFESVLDGIVVAGLTATGFAFTENILYIGTAFSEDKALGSHGIGTTTVATFIVRVLMTPFAHPLFTSMTGIGFALAAVIRPGRPWRWRWLPPVLGWMLAMGLHGTWNGSSLTSPLTFLTLYVAVMIPAFGMLVWVAFWARSNELRTVRRHLAPYAAAGWLAPGEPGALGSMGIRAEARRVARRFQGETAARAVREYAAFATHLAFLRGAATRGAPAADFAAREAELLHHLWQRKAHAQPALQHAANPPARWAPVTWHNPAPRPGLLTYQPPGPAPYPFPHPTPPADPSTPRNPYAPPKHL